MIAPREEVDHDHPQAIESVIGEPKEKPDLEESQKDVPIQTMDGVITLVVIGFAAFVISTTMWGNRWVRRSK